MKVRPPIALWFILICPSVCGQTASEPALEAASVKLVSTNPGPINCTGGPGTADPGTWRCSNVSVSFLISKAFGYPPYQFDPGDGCCQARVDIVAKVPAGTTKARFQRMQQNLLIERFKLRTHLKRKEMPVYDLVVAEKGVKMKPSTGNSPHVEQDPWGPPRIRRGKDDYPEFLPAQVGVANLFGKCRWVGVNLSMQDIAGTLSAYAGRPVIDATGLTGEYNLDIKWSVDAAALTSALRQMTNAEASPSSAQNDASGPTLLRAVHDGLGLKLNSKKGQPTSS